MSGKTRVFLVLLQLVIGWHILYEGWWKLREPSWSSRGYLRNATGPAALGVRYLSGDPEVRREGAQLIVVDPTVEIVQRFTLPPFEPGEAPEVRRWQRYLPAPVEEEWDAYLAAFVTHYGFDKPEPFAFESIALVGAVPDSGFPGSLPWGALFVAGLRDPTNPLQPGLQRILAERNATVARAESAKWLHEGTKMVRRPYLSGPKAEVPVTTPERVQEYLAKEREVRDLEANQMNTFGSKVTDRLRKARAEEASLRAGLLADLNQQTAAMKRATRQVLDYQQKRMALPEPKVEAPPEWKMLSTIDFVITWGLLLVGAGLMLGLFTRLSCVGGIVLLAMFYVSAPALPGLPENPMSEGHYLIVNKNIIEMAALLVIAVAHTGLWYGLDAWLDPLKPWKWRRRPEDGLTRPLPPRTVHAAAQGNGGALIPRK